MDGGIGAPFVTINIISVPGQRINSLFKFFTIGQPFDHFPKHLDNYYETTFIADFN